jgi:hypothetical protein
MAKATKSTSKKGNAGKAKSPGKGKLSEKDLEKVSGGVSYKPTSTPKSRAS